MFRGPSLVISELVEMLYTQQSRQPCPLILASSFQYWSRKWRRL